MPQRTGRWLLVAFLSLLVTFAIGLMRLSDSLQVTRARFERVEKGMSWEQVLHTVGGPPGDYSNGRVCGIESGIRFVGHQSWSCDLRVAVRPGHWCASR
jgi:hypothetical protein